MRCFRHVPPLAASIVRGVRFNHNHPTASYIKHQSAPACLTCTHFIPFVSKYDYDEGKYMFGRIFGHCRLFGEKDLVSGETKYEYANVARVDKRMCGIEGKFHAPKEPSAEQQFHSSSLTLTH